ncbi:MAG: aminotransferase class V-fold PLP-dependent enzyme, partial [Planctomycetota bacterium]|nr:aminotransferase class V-fold PLP-dependent enzyme [Planctomycetota bacterium]
AYRHLIDVARRDLHTEVCYFPLRDSILREKISEEVIVSRAARAYLSQECDGLLLTAVSHDGIRFPIVELVREIERQRPIGMLVVDGAQAFCHIPTAAIIERADFFVAGCHKWLGAFEPLGIAFGNPTLLGPPSRRLPELMRRHGIDDPLLNFTQQLEENALAANTETVNVTPLFACAGALKEALRGTVSIKESFQQRLRNANRVAAMAEEVGWKALRPVAGFQSGILLLEPTADSVVRLSPLDLRTHFHNRHISLTAYEGGCIRLSMPNRPFKSSDLGSLRNALHSAATADESAPGVR